MRLYFGLCLLASACVSNSVSATGGSSFILSGVYKYIDGDRVIWKCNAARRCTDVLIRDDRLARTVTELLDQRVSLRVRRVDACGPESTQVACLRSRDGTALLIVEWM